MKINFCLQLSFFVCSFGSAVLCGEALTAQDLAGNYGYRQARLKSHEPSEDSNLSLRDALLRIKNAHQIDILFEEKIVAGITVNLTDAWLKSFSAEDALTKLLKDSQLKFRKIKKNTYIIVRNNLSERQIKKQIAEQLNAADPANNTQQEGNGQTETPKHESSADKAAAAAISIGGIVVDENKAPLSGVSVTLKGTRTGTYTDKDGRFSLDVPDESRNGVLIFSFVGYDSREMLINGLTSVNISLTRNQAILSDVVIVGYGEQKRSDLTGSIVSVRPKEFEKQPLTRIDQALQGNAPGVVVSSNSGQPGGAIKVRIRGANSITGSNDPLYVIDGFIGGDISSVNINDVESIEILKDASATAIYGSRGANGVVLITTKSGKTGEKRIDFGTFFTISQLPKKLDLMNAYEFAQTINETSTAPPFSESDLQKFRTQSTDWQDEIYRNALSQNYQLSIAGGNKDVRYFVSANHSDQDGILLNSSYKRTTLRSNLDANLTRRLSVKVNLSGSRAKGHNNAYPGWKQEPQAQAPIWDPTAPVYKDDGTYNLKSQYGSIWNQPVAVANAADNDNTLSDYIGNVALTYEFIKDLKLTVRAGIEFQENLNRTLIVPDYSSGSTISSSFSTNRFTLFQNTNILTYTKKIRDIHAFTVTGIYEQQSRNAENIAGGSANLVSAATGYYNLGLGTPSLNSNYSNEAIQSFVGRLNYGLLDRYLLTVSYRYDGSSKFAKKNRYSGFPSLALAWRVSDESFLRNVSFIKDLKLRVSYGKTGNQAISPYSTLTLSNTGAFYSWDGHTITPGVSIGPPANEDLKWETTSSLNGGIDASLFNGRMSFTLDLYHKSTNDLLLAVPLPQFMGGGSYLKNIGKVENKGLEIIVGGTPVSGRDFKWTSSFNITFNKNKVVELGEGATQIYTGQNSFNGANPTYIIEKGQSLGRILGNQSLGTWKSSEATEAAVYGAKPGDEKFLDLNKDNKINGDDQSVLGNSMPKYTLGFSNDFSYKNFSLNIFFFGIRGFQLWNANKAYTMGGQGDARNATNREYLNRWRSGKETDVPVNNINVQSSRFVEDGSFIKLRNVNLSYRFPKSVVGKVKLSSIDLYVSGQNLLTITKYKGYDAEATSMFSGGGGDAIGPIDWGTIPNPRTFTVGLKVGF